ncbi:MAG: glycine oxidase ThiO [Planctomycetes bacterium]|nr:glycine oxidase ThiO [Planctomycetota bacterium]
MYDVAIVGAGVIGLSIAYELARHGRQVVVLERGAPGREASWAGAGIIPPANPRTAIHAYDQLRGWSFQLHGEWAERLRVETGVDNGFRRCGGLYLARTAGEAAALAGFAEQLSVEQVRWESVRDRLAEIAPELRGSETRFRYVLFLSDEAQLRNPRHLQALQAACAARGVDWLTGQPVEQIEVQSGRIVGLRTASGGAVAEQYCFAGGAWTGQLLRGLGYGLGILPIRGQMLLYRVDPAAVTRIINEGPRYIVPRDDGHVLVGSTEEEVGFDKSNTSEGIGELTRFAEELVPALSRDRLIRSWAGLRPASFDGLPYIGRLPDHENGFVAAGHFRSGLYLSPGTAVMMRQLMLGQPSALDLAVFRVGRG